MDNALLIPIVEELRVALVGSALGDVVQIDSRRFVFRFSVPPFTRLCVTLHPEVSALHPEARVATPKDPTELAVALSDSLGGGRLISITKALEERVIELEFDGGKLSRGHLVLELLGKASNLLLLDADRRILRYLRSHDGAFRRPIAGEIYVPPPPRRAAMPLPCGSRLLAREGVALVASGLSEADAAHRMLARVESADWEPCLYSERPLDEIQEADGLPPDRFFPAPFSLLIGEGMVRTGFDTAGELTSAYTHTLLRHLAFRDLQGALTLLVRGEREKAVRLVQTLEREAGEAKESGSNRRRGELLLASLGTARKEGSEVELVDYFDPSMPRVRLALDPRLDLRGNAEALFRRARKLKRAAGVIAQRLDAARHRAGALEEFGARVAAIPSADALQDLETELNRSGLVKVFRKPERREVGRKPAFVRVREYRTADGFVVLVGKTAAENDLLTFKIAAPHDFWLHAAGRSGAHVVVRNPKRSKDLPEPALMEAAAIAAWFSKGPREGETDVHYSHRKDVRKGKGMSPGMVMLKRFRTVRVRAALPRGVAPEEAE